MLALCFTDGFVSTYICLSFFFLGKGLDMVRGCDVDGKGGDRKRTYVRVFCTSAQLTFW